MAGLIKGLHHASLKCNGSESFQKTVGFYKDILGLPIVKSWGEGDSAGIMLDTGAGIIEIFADAQDTPGQGAVRHFALATDDTDACVKAVTDAGYEVFMGPENVDIPSSPAYPVRIAFCKGPLGEEIEFFQER